MEAIKAKSSISPDWWFPWRNPGMRKKLSDVSVGSENKT